MARSIRVASLLTHFQTFTPPSPLLESGHLFSNGLRHRSPLPAVPARQAPSEI